MIEETVHDWETERIRGRRRTVAMPASLKRRCRRCGMVQFKSSSLGSNWVVLTRPVHADSLCEPLWITDIDSEPKEGAR